VNTLKMFLVWLGSRLNIWFIVALVLGINVYWAVTLHMFDINFQSVAGLQLLDLQNSLTSDAIITTQRALAQIATYTPQAKSLYWSFFILDNIMPHLAFSSYALLWVYFLRSNPTRLTTRLMASPLLLIPLGVGFFDWLENLAYITAIHSFPNPGATQAMDIGIIFKWVKAAFIPPTFLITLVLTIYHLANIVRRRLMRPQQQTV
jgi:hypothetical protein